MDYLVCILLFLKTNVAVIVSISALTLSFYVAWLQRRHMKLSVKPIPEISFGDYENVISVALENNGLGPLYIKSFKVNNMDDGIKQFRSLVACTEIDVVWDTFVDGADNRYLRQGEVLELIRYSGNIKSKIFRKNRDSIRNTLSKLEVEILYSSVYQEKHSRYTRDLKWFGR